MKKKKRTKQMQNNLRTVIVTMSILFFITIAGFYLFNLYITIPIENTKTSSNYDSQKTVQTIEQVKEADLKVEEMIEQASNCVVGISKLKDNGTSIFLKDGITQLGLGSGVIVSENGYILTNQHVSGEKYSKCYVTLENGKSYTADVVWADNDLDLAMVKINVKGLAFASLGDSDKMKVAQTVYAIGNPIGYEFQRTITAGIISAKDRTIKIEEQNKQSYMEDLIQTDATINPGNSGGPLINTSGEVIGINTVKITSAEGIGFAIPINIVKPIIQSYMETGNFEEAAIGIFSYDKQVIPYLDSKLELKNGIYVVDVNENGAAKKAGIMRNDIILKIDDKQLNKMSELRSYIYTKKPGDEVTLLVQRKGISSEVKITLKNK